MRITAVLARVPVIKFRKGGSGSARSAAPATAAAAGGKAPGACPMMQAPAAPMSTGQAIPDIDLPARYRRQPLSEEEIDHINGGGIV